MQTINFNHLQLKAGDTLLDLGCGEGRHAIGAIFHSPDIYVAAIDLNFDDLSTAKNRHQEFNRQAAAKCLYTNANGFALPFADNTFDHVVCSEVLEHIHDYQKALDEINRVLRPGGTLNISVPRYWPEKICWWLSREYYNVEGGHIRIFNSQTLKSDIKNLSYNFRTRHWAHALHVPYWWLRCAFWSQGDNFFLTRWYHKLLVWDLLKRPLLTRALDRLLNPLMGKSIVMYFVKPETE